MMKTVYPAIADAMILAKFRSERPALSLEAGVQWPADSFTNSRLADGSITEDASAAYRPAAEPETPAAAEPPIAAAPAPAEHDPS